MSLTQIFTLSQKKFKSHLNSSDIKCIIYNILATWGQQKHAVNTTLKLLKALSFVANSMSVLLLEILSLLYTSPHEFTGRSCSLHIHEQTVPPLYEVLFPDLIKRTGITKKCLLTSIMTSGGNRDVGYRLNTL